jgi:hypothetical protein
MSARFSCICFGQFRYALLDLAAPISVAIQRRPGDMQGFADLGNRG